MAAVWGLEAQTEIQKRLDAADLGYLRMDIVDPFCGVSAWGLFNDRPLDPQKVESIRKSYHLMGPLACQNDKVIYLPMNPAWFVGPTTPVIAGKYVYQVPLLELTPAGKQALADGEFHPLSGNHRRAALVLYYEDLQESLKLLNEELEDLAGDALKAKQQEVKVMQKRMENAPFWTIKVYDIGAWYSVANVLQVH